MTPATSAPDIRRSRGSELSAIFALFVLTLRQHTHGKRLLVLILLYALPCGLAILLRSLPRPASPEDLEFALIFNLLPHGLAPLTALLYSAGIIQDEVEEQTLTYLMMRSVPRWAIYVTKFFATWLVATLLISAATIGLYAAVYAGTPQFASEIVASRLPRVLAINALGQFAYCAIFGLIGLIVKRSLVAGMIYIVGVEGILANQDFVLRLLTIVHYIRTLVLRWLDFPPDLQRRILRNWSLKLDEMPTAEQAVQRLALTGLIGVAIAAIWFARHEFRVKTPEGN